MLLRGQRVDHRDRRPARPLLELLVRVHADGERIEVARQRTRGVGQRLPARQLQLLGREVHGGAAELRHAGRERDTRARRMLREVQAERRAREQRLLRVEPQLDGAVEDRLRFGGAEV